MLEGDIYHWVWADPERDNAGAFGDYHCKSRIAVFEGGKLYDTFWGSGPTDNSFLREEDVKLTLRGNRHDMDVLKDNASFYRSEDIVSMKHSNSSSAVIYVKRGAKRDLDIMLKRVEEKIRDAEHRKRSAEFDLGQLALAKAEIESGKTKVYF